jgi:hypothetical protein
MIASDIKFTDKFKALLRSNKRIIHCEGVTGSGKSFQLGVKFFFKVFNSTKEHKQFVIAASTSTVAEKMFIDNPASFYNIFRHICKHQQQGVGGNRIIVETPTGRKIVYLVGYDDKTRYKQILGLSVYGFLIEEIHTATSEFIREVFTRVYRNDGFLYTSSNGGMPDLTVYLDYLNKARPNPQFIQDVPESTLNYLMEKDADDDFEFWFYKFEDNTALSQELIDKMYSSHPVGTFEYNSKILGIRGFVEGAIYARYLSKEKNMIPFSELYNPQSKYQFQKYTIGIDVGSTDFTVITLVGFTMGFKEIVVIDSKEINHVGSDEIWTKIKELIDPYFPSINRYIYGAFIDSAAQILKTTLRPKFMNDYRIQIADSYKYTIKERVDWGIRLLHEGRLIFTDKTQHIYNSFMKTLYSSNSKATDIREYSNHKDKDNIDSTEYAITPFIKNILQQ